MPFKTTKSPSKKTVVINKKRFDSDILPSEITSETNYFNRRIYIGAAGTLAMGGLLSSCADADSSADKASAASTTDASKQSALKLLPANKSLSNGFYTDEVKTPYKNITAYNKFYEFGTDKSDPARHAHKLVTDPWSIPIKVVM